MKLSQILHDDIEFSTEPNGTGGVALQGLNAAIMPTMPQTSAPQSTNTQNPIDVISLDVPLLIRLLEWAKEEAKDDMQLHSLAEKLTSLSQSGQQLSMENYDDIIASCCNKSPELVDIK